MKERKLEIYLFFGLLGLALFLTFQILQPYLFILVMATVFAVIFHPMHNEIKTLMPKHKSISALASVLIVVLLVLLPILFFGIQISSEIKDVYSSSFLNGYNGGFFEIITNVANNVIGIFSPAGNNLITFNTVDTTNYFFSIITWLRDHVAYIFSGVAKFFLGMFLFLISFYYLLKDGDKLRKDIVAISPFRDDRDEAILSKLENSVVSVVKGSIFVALIQGVVSGIGYYIFGLPSAVLWAGVTATAALVPGFGTSIALVPAILYLLFMVGIPNAIGLLIWGIFAVGLIDNFLGPKFMEKRVNIHPLLIMLSALGGLSFYGAAGFFLGPITISFLFALFDIYKNIIVKDDKVG